MGGVVSRFAFMPPSPATYTADDPLFETIASGSGSDIFIQHVAPGRALASDTHIVVYAHGNAEDLGINADMVEYLADVCGVEALAFDYSGYGPATVGTVKPTQSKAFADMDAVIEHVTGELKIPLSQVVLIGRSLGSGPTCYAAATYPEVAGVFLISPLASAMRTQLPFSVPGVDIMRNASRIPRVEAPVAILHGTADRVVPFSHGQELATSAPNLWRLIPVEGAGHNDLIQVMGMSAYFGAIREFVSDLPTTAREPSSPRQPRSGFSSSLRP